MPSRSRDDSQHRWWELPFSVPAPRGPLECTPHHILFIGCALHVIRGVGVPPPVLPVGGGVVYLYLSWDWSWQHLVVYDSILPPPNSLWVYILLAGTT